MNKNWKHGLIGLGVGIGFFAVLLTIQSILSWVNSNPIKFAIFGLLLAIVIISSILYAKYE